MKASNTSMPDIAAALSRQAGHPVEDHTGLNGGFDFEIQWAPDEIPDSSYPSLGTVLKAQLGIKLQPTRGTLDIFVIDQIAHPSNN